MRTLVLCSLLASGCAMWDGAFPTAEYRFHVRDVRGAPVAGAKLEVRDADGKSAFRFPIEEHRESAVPIADATGTITVHHVSLGLEFGGTCTAGFVGTCSDPKFTLRFVERERSAVIDYASLLSPNTTEAWEAFDKLPRAKTTLSMELERAYDADPANRATLRPRVLAAWQANDKVALAAPTPVTLDFHVIDRDVTLR